MQIDWKRTDLNILNGYLPNGRQLVSIIPCVGYYAVEIATAESAYIPYVVLHADTEERAMRFSETVAIEEERNTRHNLSREQFKALLFTCHADHLLKIVETLGVDTLCDESDTLYAAVLRQAYKVRASEIVNISEPRLADQFAFIQAVINYQIWKSGVKL